MMLELHYSRIMNSPWQLDSFRSMRILLIILLSGAVPVSAGELPSEMDILADIPLVSSATRLQQLPEDSPATVTLIDHEMIRASGAVNIADLFRLVPGFQVGHVNGHDFSVTSHGLADEFPRRLLIQVDGRSLHTALNSTVDWSNLPLELEDIERIEVISGPNVASYGTNAFNGVINITTRRPFQDQGNYVRLTAGSQETGRGMFRHGGRNGNFEYRVSGSHLQNSGIDTVHDDTRANKLSFSGNYQQDLRDQFDIQLGLAEGTYGVGLPGDVFEPHRDRDSITHYEYLRWTRALNATDSLYVQLYHNRHKMDDDYTIGPLLDVVNDLTGLGLDNTQFMSIFGIDGNQSITYGLEDIDTHRYDLELQHSLQPRDDLRLVWGGGLRYDTIKGRYKFAGDQDEEDLTSRIFASLESQLTNRLVLNAGANLENNSIVGTEISPRIGLNYHLTPNHTVRIGAARAYRTPSLLEAHEYNVFTFEGGSPLVRKRTEGLQDAEKITSLELGFIGHWLDRALTLDVKLYREKISPVIETVQDKRDPSDDPYGLADFVQIINNDVGSVDIDGAEVRLAYRPLPSTFISLQYAYANPRGIFIRSYSDDPSNAGLGSCPGPPDAAGFYQICDTFSKRTPEHSFSMLGSYKINPEWQVSLAAYSSSRFIWFGNGDRLPGYERFDARLARSFRTAKSTGEVALIAQNIGGDYLEFRDDNPFDTRVYLQFSLSFM
jgi:iron complex outermembrane receptor protein